MEFFIDYLRESEVDGTQDELADLVDDAVEAVLSGLTQQRSTSTGCSRPSASSAKLLEQGYDG